MSVNYGSKRLVTGAHYGLRDWLAQRLTALLMALFTIVLLAQVVCTSGPIGYEQWAGIFAQQWMKFITVATLVALAYHAWVGMREVLMDYVSAVGPRLLLQLAVLVWLVGCLGWGLQVLWRL